MSCWYFSLALGLYYLFLVVLSISTLVCCRKTSNLQVVSVDMASFRLPIFAIEEEAKVVTSRLSQTSALFAYSSRQNRKAC